VAPSSNNASSAESREHDLAPAAVEPAIFSFSADRSKIPGLLSSACPQHALDAAVDNIILKERSRRRVLARRMRDKISFRALCFVMCEWQRAVVEARAADGVNSVRKELVTQRCLIFRAICFMIV
jgi:hypothetical protein